MLHRMSEDSEQAAEIDRRRREIELFRKEECTRGQFQATAVWNGIMAYLRNTVEVKKHRVRLRSYDQCFTGADAVDTVFQYVTQKVTGLGINQISREQAAKICQVMIQLNVINSVHDGEKNFEDSSTRCFRFVNASNGQLNLFSGVNTQPSNDFSEVFSPERCQNKASDESMNGSIISNHGIIFGSSVELCHVKGHHKSHYRSARDRKHCSTEYMGPQKMNSPHLTPMNFIRRASLPNCAQLSASSLRTSTPWNPSSDFRKEEFLRETALCTLLTLVDVPVLDGIVSADQGSQDNQRLSFTQLSLVFSNFNLQYLNSAPEHFFSLDGRSGDNDDEWWQSALGCLELIPGGHDIYSRVVADGAYSGAQPQNVDKRKTVLFGEMVDQYQCLSSALWADSYSDLQMELYRLLMRDCLELALRAFQLSLVILSKDAKEHIHRLLKFMRCAADDNQVRLSSEISNRLVIERNLTSVVVKNRRLNQHQTTMFVMFMVDHVEDVWKIPDDVAETVKARFSNSGERTLEKTYCRRISKDEYCRQKVELTEKSLVDLMNYILDNTQMSLKEKKLRFKLYAKQHRNLYLKHFADIT